MAEKEKKKKRSWKRWVFYAFLIGIVYIYFQLPHGAFSFGLGLFSEKNSTQNGANPEKVVEKARSKETVIYMLFNNDVLELDGVSYPRQKDLEAAIRGIQKRYASSEITVKYLQKGNDPYVLSKQTEKLLRDNNFGFTIKKNDNYGKEK